MQIEHRSFSSQIARPTPEVTQDEDLGFFSIITPWGKRSTAQRVAEIIKDYLINLRGDPDATSPFPRMTCLSTNANNLRIAAMLANEQIYREENHSDYNSGVEIFAISIDENELSWLQLGHPNIFLKRPQRGLVPLGSHLDLPMDVTPPNTSLYPPLPNSVLGLDPTANFLVGSFIPQKEDQIIMVSRSYLPTQFYQSKTHDFSIKKMTQILANDNPEVAFWVGSLVL